MFRSLVLFLIFVSLMPFKTFASFCDYVKGGKVVITDKNGKKVEQELIGEHEIIERAISSLETRMKFAESLIKNQRIVVNPNKVAANHISNRHRPVFEISGKKEITPDDFDEIRNRVGNAKYTSFFSKPTEMNEAIEISKYYLENTKRFQKSISSVNLNTLTSNDISYLVNRSLGVFKKNLPNNLKLNSDEVKDLFLPQIANGLKLSDDEAFKLYVRFKGDNSNMSKGIFNKVRKSRVCDDKHDCIQFAKGSRVFEFKTCRKSSNCHAEGQDTTGGITTLYPVCTGNSEILNVGSILEEDALVFVDGGKIRKCR